MKKVNKLATTIITIVSVIIFTLYGKLIHLSLKEDSVAGYWRVIIASVTAAFVLAMIYTGYKRIHEIDKEDKDDLSKY